MENQPIADTVEIGHGFLRRTSCPTCGSPVERGYNSGTFWCPRCNGTLDIFDLPAAVRASRVVGAFEKITPDYWLQNAGDIYHARSDYISQRAAKED